MFIQAFSDNKPVFEAPWLPSHQVIAVAVPEEGQSGTTVYTLRARDPVSGERLLRATSYCEERAICYERARNANNVLRALEKSE